jgi:hypothetical protein
MSQSSCIVTNATLGSIDFDDYGKALMDYYVVYEASHLDKVGKFEVEYLKAIRHVPSELTGRQLVAHLKKAIAAQSGAKVTEIRVLELSPQW